MDFSNHVGILGILPSIQRIKLKEVNMSCGEPTQHPELFEERTSRKEHLKIYSKAIDITPNEFVMQNGAISKTDKNWYGNKVKQNFFILVEIWEEINEEII
jgi:hypothetical protein